MSEFSLDLNEDQLQMQKWVHDFAENVIRPVAAEYDEKEETPWEVIQEAAKIDGCGFWRIYWHIMLKLQLLAVCS